MCKYTGEKQMVDQLNIAALVYWYFTAEQAAETVLKKVKCL